MLTHSCRPLELRGAGALGRCDGSGLFFAHGAERCLGSTFLPSSEESEGAAAESRIHWGGARSVLAASKKQRVRELEPRGLREGGETRFSLLSQH